MTRSGFVFHEDFLQHDTGAGHPERPDRLRHLMSHLRTGERLGAMVEISPQYADLKWIQGVHPIGYIESIQSACKPDLHFLDCDTVVSQHSYQTALLAVGGTLAACDAVIKGQVRNAFCAVRPPGHHAESTRAMGFCLFNNVAVAARYLQAQHSLSKICIIDWDVHHGNGTQNAFYRDPSVFYISIHQYPLFPGTGKKGETGEADGEGTTLNFLCPAGYGDKEYLRIFETEIAPAVERFGPDFILISAGFDAHRDDPLANMKVTEEGFAGMTEVATTLAAKCCNGRLVSLLEGGYNLEALARSVETHLRKLAI